MLLRSKFVSGIDVWWNVYSGNGGDVKGEQKTAVSVGVIDLAMNTLDFTLDFSISSLSLLCL
jgi:hypothetical protein